MRCNTGEVRLRGGTREDEGRVELCMNGVWGTVCDNSWNDTEASVVCRQLGFSRFRKFLLSLYSISSLNNIVFFPSDFLALGDAYYGEGSGPVYIDTIDCRGNESNLTDCTYTTSSTCSHSQDAGVQCRAERKNDTHLSW